MRDAFDTSREIAWEMRGVTEAVRRYREAAGAADPSTLSAGRKLMREIVPGLSALIAAGQIEGARSASSNRGEPPAWAWACQMLHPDKQAVIVLNHGLRASLQGGVGGTGGVLPLGLQVVATVRDQIEHDRWEEEQAETQRGAKAAGERRHDVLRAFQQAHPNPTRRVWARWRRKVHALRLEPWPNRVAVVYGTWLVGQLAAAAPNRFSVVTIAVPGGRTMNTLRLTPETRLQVQDIQTRAEVAQPMLYPMIVPPNPWRYEETPCPP